MPEPGELRRIQYDFAAHLRDPDNVPAPADIEPRRMAIYRDLFFNNVRQLLGGTFPVLCDLLGEERWALLIRDFYRDHKSRSPLFPDLPREFLHYLADERSPENATDEQPDPPFMYELAHYEWVEAGLMLAQDHTPEAIADGNLLEGVPVVSTVAWLLAYDWPVNKIGSAWQPTEPAEQPLYYLVYRNSDEKIIFVTLNAVSARLFEILNEDNARSGREALLQLAAELKHPDADQVVTSGTAILEEWRSRGIIAGTAAN